MAQYCVEIVDGPLVNRTIAQNEETCVVYGMPKEAVKRGGVEKSVPLEAIEKDILHQLTLSNA